MFENIEWKLSAEDAASATFDKVAKSQEKVADSSDDMAKAVKKSGSSWTDIAKGVFAGTAALDAAKMAFGFLKTQISDSIGEAMEYERVQAQLNAVLASTQGAAGLTITELNNMADSFANLAVGGSESVNTLQAMLLTFTNIGRESFEGATKAALDMATAMNGGVLPTAEQLQGQAIQLGKALNDPIEGISALTRVGVKFTDGQKQTIKTLMDTGRAMEAQQIILEELSKEFGGSAEAAAKTYQGRLVALQNAIGDVKKQIGQLLLPTLAALTDSVVDSAGKVKINDATMKMWQRRIFETAISVKTIIQIIGGFIGVIGALGNIFIKSVHVIMAWGTDVIKGLFKVGDSAKKVFQAIRQALTGDFGGALDTLKDLVKDRLSTTINYVGQYGQAWVDVGGAIKAGMDNAGRAIVNMAQQTAKFEETQNAINETAGAAGNLGNALNNMGNSDGAKKASDDAKKLSDEVNKLSGNYQAAREKIDGALLDLEESHTENITKIKNNLVGLQKSLEETTAAYQRTMADMNKTEAERVVDQERNIADMQKRLADLQGAGAGSEGGASPEQQTQIADLQEQLDREQAAYAAYIESRKGLETELTEARRRASLTEFERFVEDINARRSQEQVAFQERIARIQEEVAEQQAALTEENTVYEAKKAMYATVNAAFQAFHDQYLSNLESMRGYTSESVGVMETELARIVKLFEQIQSVRQSAGLAGISLGSPTDGASDPSGSTNNSITQQVTINVTTEGSGAAQTANDIVAEIQRQLELAKAGSQ